MANTSTTWTRTLLVMLVSAVLGFMATSSLFQTAFADGSHYEQSDWTNNPVMWGNSDMFFPLSNYEGATLLSDDPWDAPAGAWINILVQGTKALPHSIDAGAVADFEIWWTDFYSSDPAALCTTQTTHNFVLFEITRARIQCNENNSISWHSHTASAVSTNQRDVLTALIHEVGHAIGVQHRTFAMDGTADGYGWCASGTSSSANYANQATMCQTLPNWTGAGTVFPAGRTLHSHEISDLAANY